MKILTMVLAMNLVILSTASADIVDVFCNSKKLSDKITVTLVQTPAKDGTLNAKISKADQLVLAKIVSDIGISADGGYNVGILQASPQENITGILLKQYQISLPDVKATSVDVLQNMSGGRFLVVFTPDNKMATLTNVCY